VGSRKGRRCPWTELRKFAPDFSEMLAGKKEEVGGREGGKITAVGGEAVGDLNPRHRSAQRAASAEKRCADGDGKPRHLSKEWPSLGQDGRTGLGSSSSCGVPRIRGGKEVESEEAGRGCGGTPVLGHGD